MNNRALAQSIQDVVWRSFLSKLEYKAKLYGKTFITVAPKNTTQTCSECGHIMSGKDKLTLKAREWRCPKCGAYHIASSILSDCDYFVTFDKKIVNYARLKSDA